MINNFKDYGFIIAIILLIVLNITSLYFIKNGNNSLNEKIVNLTKEYNKKINDDLVKVKNEYDEKVKNILSNYELMEAKKKKIIKPIASIKTSDSQVSSIENKQPKGVKELSDAFNFNGYPNSIMYCYTSPK